MKIIKLTWWPLSLISMICFLLATVPLSLSGQETITKWDFEGDVLTPAIGNGTAQNIGGTSTAFATGFGGGRAWNTSNYPTQGTGSGTAGVQFTVSTDSYQNIVITWDMRHSNTAANRVRLKYTINGTDWINFNANNTNATNTLQGNDVGFDNGRYIANAGDSWYQRSANFSGIAGVNNNPLFAIRFVSEFVDGSNYGASTPTSSYSPLGTWRFDNVTFLGDAITGGNAVKLAITSVNGGVPPTVNAPFTVTVQSQDANGVPANVTVNTQITLSKETGTGNLGGTLTGTINAGTNSVTISGVTYNVAESGVSIKATATSGMTLSPGISAPFQVLPAATHLKFVGVPANGTINQPISQFTVEARRPDNTVDLSFTGTITITKYTGPGNLQGTTSVNAVQGVATFSDISFSASGTYSLEATASNLLPDISPSIQIFDLPQAVAEILPLYISGNDPPDNRIPFAFRVTISNLIPNATYRYINQAVITGDSPTTNGAGNVIFVNADGTFVRTTSPSFSTPNAHGQFTASMNGTFTGWFILEPTNNPRFTPGNHIFMRIRINDGAGGTSVAHYLTVADSVKVIGFSTNSDPNYGTGARAVSFATPKNFVFLYDNTTGTGRPLFGTSIETTGIDFTQIPQYTPFYKEFVSGYDGAWGAIIPNVNPNGVKRIEERSRLNGSVVTVNTSASGVWGAANTVNPTGGLQNILVINLIDIPVLFVNPSSLSGFTYEYGQGPSAAQTYSVTGQNLAGQGFITVTAPASFEISLNGTTFTNQFQLEYSNGQVVNQPVTVHVRLKAGLNIGNYSNELITHTAPIINQVNVICSGTVTPPYVPPAIEQAILPLYIQGINGTNETRVPFAYWVTISNLQPGTTYRYINQVVNYSDSPTTNGAGNVIFATQSGSFYRTTSPNFETSGNYGEFTTTASGTYSGWFITEPTGNARFTPGSYIRMRIRLNDGQGGTTPAHYLTTSDSVLVINFGTASTLPNGTAIRGVSNYDPKNFVFLYDNIQGTGRPISGTTVEPVGIDFTQIVQYAPFYRDFVSGVYGAWGTIIPNVLPNGVRRIEQRRLSDGSIKSSITSVDGTWYGVNTVNPTGGLNNIIVIDLTTGLDSPEKTTYQISGHDGQLLIKTSEPQPLWVTITNMAGQVVLTTRLNGSDQYTINHQLKSGLYIITLSDGITLHSQKLFLHNQY